MLGETIAITRNPDVRKMTAAWEERRGEGAITGISDIEYGDIIGLAYCISFSKCN
jgi:hypothetical protein